MQFLAEYATTSTGTSRQKGSAQLCRLLWFRRHLRWLVSGGKTGVSRGVVDSFLVARVRLLSGRYARHHDSKVRTGSPRAQVVDS